MTRDAYDLKLPENHDTSVIFSSPHSGRDYSHMFLGDSVLDQQTIRSSEDAFVDQLFDGVPDLGAPLLAATAPRAFIDLNRAPDELDPALIDGVERRHHNPRINSGLGVIPRVVANGRAIYHGKITRQEADRRIGQWWRPYHDRLQRLLDTSQFMFGEAILIDCHSMPHEAIEAIAKSGAPAADVVLGDRFGAAARGDVVDRIESAFQKAGLRVARNTPFAGAFVTQHYGRPGRNQHCVQVELDRGLYMDEKRVERLPDFGDFRALIREVAADIANIGRKSERLAAE